MRIQIISLFPEAFGSFLRTGLLKKAVERGALHVGFTNPRDFARDRHRTVDDTPYGGGHGMVLMVDPVAQALEAAEPADAEARPRRVLLTPQGAPFCQAAARRLAAQPSLSLVCGRYEGVDERVRALVDEELSLGDFVLLGGEVAAMAVVEATARLLPGVLGNAASAEEESYSRGLLEYPQYTRPARYRDMAVPEVLLSGDHAAISRWRRKQSLHRTRDRRPDLFAALDLSAEERALLAEPLDEVSP